MAASVLTALKEQLTCSICMSVYTKPRTLKCLHSFCLLCLQDLADKTQSDMPLRCPDCKADIHLPPGASVDTLPNAFYFDRLLELLAIKEPEVTTANCGGCNRNLPLTSFCFDCGQFLCRECENAHKLFQLLKDHRLVPLKQLKDAGDVREFLEQTNRCCVESRGKEKLEYFCEYCKACICQKCAMVEHRAHKFDHIKKAAERCKAAIKEAGTRVRAKTPVIRDAITAAGERHGFITQRIEAARRQVKDHVEQFAGLFKIHKWDLFSELQKIKEYETRRYETTRKELEAQLAKLTSTLELVDTTVKRNMSYEIINTHESLVKRCTELTVAANKHVANWRKVDIKYEDFTKSTPGRLICTGIPDNFRSTFVDRSLKDATIGSLSEIAVLVARDSHGQICSSGGDCVEATAVALGAIESLTVLDQKNGYYTIQYTPRSFTRCQVYVKISGRALADSPFVVRVKDEFLWRRWPGSGGSGGGRIDYYPWGIAVNSRGEVAVTERHRIELFTSDGSHMRTIGCYGSGKGQFKQPAGIAFDSEDRMIVADRYNNRMQILDSTGAARQYVKTFGEIELIHPGGVCVTNDGSIAVSCAGVKRGVNVFNRDGVFTKHFDDSKRVYPPYSITYGSEKFFVSYAEDHVVSAFNREGVLLFSFLGGPEDASPLGLAVDKRNRILVCGYRTGGILLFAEDGTFLHKTKPEGASAVCTGTSQKNPVAIAVSPSGQVYAIVAIGHSARIYVLEKNFRHATTGFIDVNYNFQGMKNFVVY